MQQRAKAKVNRNQSFHTCKETNKKHVVKSLTWLDNEKSEHQHQLDLNTVLHQEHTIEDTKKKKQHNNVDRVSLKIKTIWL